MGEIEMFRGEGLLGAIEGVGFVPLPNMGSGGLLLEIFLKFIQILAIFAHF